MTWTISINGHDDLSGDEKEVYERRVIDAARDLTAELAALAGGHVTSATGNTNTTGSVNLREPQA